MKWLVPLTMISIMIHPPVAQSANVKASSTGDVCEIRPDLCGGSETSRTRASKKMKPAPKDFDDDDLEKDFDAMTDVEPIMQDRKREAVRRPSSTAVALPNAVMSYDSYLQMNNMNPALARRPASMSFNQKAFVPPVIKSTITGSTLDQPDTKGGSLDTAPAGSPAPLTLPVTPPNGPTN